jgi:hypothetical protein
VFARFGTQVLARLAHEYVQDATPCVTWDVVEVVAQLEGASMSDFSGRRGQTSSLCRKVASAARVPSSYVSCSAVGYTSSGRRLDETVSAFEPFADLADAEAAEAAGFGLHARHAHRQLQAGSGCYSMTSHTCDCTATAATCGGVWTPSCGCAVAASPPSAAATSLPITGSYMNAWGGTIVISSDAYISGGTNIINITHVDTTEGFFVGQNSGAGSFNPGLWSRVDWLFDSSGGLHMCTTHYNAANESMAMRPGGVTHNHSLFSTSGCNGFSFSALSSLSPPPSPPPPAGGVTFTAVIQATGAGVSTASVQSNLTSAMGTAAAATAMLSSTSYAVTVTTPPTMQVFQPASPPPPTPPPPSPPPSPLPPPPAPPTACLTDADVSSWVPALNEPCYVHDAVCEGYPVCCVTAGTCRSQHGGMVSSNRLYYEGGCHSDASSHGITGPGCHGMQGECNIPYLQSVLGATTRPSAITNVSAEVRRASESKRVFLRVSAFGVRVCWLAAVRL